MPLFQIPTASPGIDCAEPPVETHEPVMYMSFAFTAVETRYHTTEREALALLKALEECRWVIVGPKYPTKFYTDHQALVKILQERLRRGD